MTAASPVAAASTAAPNASVSSTAIPNISPSPTATASGPSANSAEMDLLGSLSDSFSSNPLAIMPVLPATSEADAHANSGLAPAFSTTQTTQVCMVYLLKKCFNGVKVTLDRTLSSRCHMFSFCFRLPLCSDELDLP